MKSSKAESGKINYLILSEFKKRGKAELRVISEKLYNKSQVIPSLRNRIEFLLQHNYVETTESESIYTRKRIVTFYRVTHKGQTILDFFDTRRNNRR